MKASGKSGWFFAPFPTSSPTLFWAENRWIRPNSQEKGHSSLAGATLKQSSSAIKFSDVNEEILTPQTCQFFEQPKKILITIQNFLIKKRPWKDEIERYSPSTAEGISSHGSRSISWVITLQISLWISEPSIWPASRWVRLFRKVGFP